MQHNPLTEIVDRGGFTPLLTACELGSDKAVKLLLEHQADVNEALPTGRSAVVVAARLGCREVVQRLLEARARPRKRPNPEAGDAAEKE